MYLLAMDFDAHNVAVQMTAILATMMVAVVAGIDCVASIAFLGIVSTKSPKRAVRVRNVCTPRHARLDLLV